MGVTWLQVALWNILWNKGADGDNDVKMYISLTCLYLPVGVQVLIENRQKAVQLIMMF